MIAEYPLEWWNGGKVRHIARDKIILLERGQVFTIEGNRFFTFGGASSHDIQGGILDRDSPTYDKEKKEPFGAVCLIESEMYPGGSRNFRPRQNFRRGVIILKKLAIWSIM